MRTVVRLCVALVAVALAAPLLAQGKVNLSGTWMFDREKSDPPPAMGGRGGGGGRGGAMDPDSIVIRQTATELVIERQAGGQAITATYKLDGSESTNARPRGEAKTKSRWEGNALVTEGTRSLSTPRGDFTLSARSAPSSSTGRLRGSVTSRGPRHKRS